MNKKKKKKVLRFKDLRCIELTNENGKCTARYKTKEYPADSYGEPIKHIVRHSPTGFAWGYGGSGPADLSLSICTLFGKEELYQDFKWELIAKLDMTKSHVIPAIIIKDTFDRIERTDNK